MQPAVKSVPIFGLNRSQQHNPRGILHLRDDSIPSRANIKGKDCVLGSQTCMCKPKHPDLSTHECRKLTNCSVGPKGASQQNAACVTNDIHPPPQGREECGEISNIPEFLHAADLNPRLRKEQCFGSGDGGKTPRHIVADQMRGSFPPTARTHGSDRAQSGNYRAGRASLHQSLDLISLSKKRKQHNNG